MKIRREFIMSKYRNVIDAIYENKVDASPITLPAIHDLD